MKNLILFALSFMSPALCLGSDQLVLEPARVECKIVPMGSSRRCDLFYDELQIHEGRETSPAFANGDCVKCRSVVDSAKAAGKSILMIRGNRGNVDMDWNIDGFFQVSGGLGCD